MPKWNNETGASLIMVMLTLTVLSMLGLALAATAFSNLKLTTVDREHQAVFYIAEGGANQAYAEIKALIDEKAQSASEMTEFFAALSEKIHNIDQITYENFETSFGESPSAHITVKHLMGDNPRTYQITSKGTIGNRTRSVTREIQVEWQSGNSVELPETTVAIVRNQLELHGGANLEGNVYIDSSNPGSVNMDGGTAVSNGSVFVPGDAVDGAFQGPPPDEFTPPDIKAKDYSVPWQSYDDLINSFPSFPSYPIPPDKIIGDQYNPFKVIDQGNLNVNKWQAEDYVLDVKENLYFHNFNMDEDLTLTINTNDKDVDIVVDNFLLKNGHIKIIGSGTVNFYVKNRFELGSSSSVNINGNSKQVNMYLAKDDLNLHFGGGQKIFGSVFAKDANINLTQGSGVHGNIVTGGDSVVFDGGTYAETFLIAPHADVKLLQGTEITGSLIANSLYGEGGVKAKFKPIDMETFPFGSGGNTGELITKQPIVETSSN
ncbi:hypothetical protein F9U64_09215 [Gracilibacillus oryzae]|uniref:DUF7305 domain-containing protein n=1 Tax=Gracilibacillus oryzae TaxID=1672701 RepID=A0A7C8GTJ8_9BACI|nr:pilus assembly PilX N-terminal domain-containing protein [Gracilibacillus oryzae]KAB8137492.1 hypothetical protein F9U64_09215 [Gracilibacillus oryzae]